MEDFLREPGLAAPYRTVVFAGMHAVDARRRNLLAALDGDGRRLVYLSGTGAADGAMVSGGMQVPEPDGLTAEAFHGIVCDSGGYVPVDRPGLQISMNGDFVSMHCLVPGRYRFRLPCVGDWENVKTGRLHRMADEIDLDLVAGETRWYRRNPPGTAGL